MSRLDREFEMMQRMAPRAKKPPTMKTREGKYRSTKEQEHEDALLALALAGVLNADGSFKF